MTVPNARILPPTAAALLVLSAAAAAPDAGRAQVALGPALEARVWLDRGDEPLLQLGDRVRVYYRAAQDAYVAIFHIDTDGTSRLVFPRSPDEDHYVRGGRDYRLLFPLSPYWYVEDQPGVGYYFIVASFQRFDFSRFRFSHYDYGWDLSLVGRHVYRDPYLAIDDYVAALLPDWERVPYALDFTSYDVGERYEYPRFLCYDCHGFRSYGGWNPYRYACTTFRVVIYDDPYFYPARRYRGDRVVWARPPTPERPRFAFTTRAATDPREPLVSPRVISEADPTQGGAVPRRSPEDGAGGVPSGVAPDRAPTDLGIIRGGSRTGTSAAAPRAQEPVPVLPTDRAGIGVARRGRPAVGAPSEPEVRAGPPPDEDARMRPVLLKRPERGAVVVSPGAEPERERSSPPQASPLRGRAASGAAVTAPPARPRTPVETPAAGRRSGSAAPTSARPGAGAPRPPVRQRGEPPQVRPRGRGGVTAPQADPGRSVPVVRVRPDGRPVVRRESGR